MSVQRLNASMDIVEGSIAAVAAAFSGWAAYSAMKAARSADRNSRTANRTAELAYQTAESVAQIERDRWHRELTPKIAFRVTKERGYVELLVLYGGPSSLGRLTSVELRVRDDRDRSNDPILGGGLTAEERDATIWGPYRFRHSTNSADETGRSIEPLSLLPGEEYRGPRPDPSPSAVRRRLGTVGEGLPQQGSPSLGRLLCRGPQAVEADRRLAPTVW